MPTFRVKPPIVTAEEYKGREYPLPKGILLNGKGAAMTWAPSGLLKRVNPGDWIVPLGDKFEVFTKEEFLEQFEPTTRNKDVMDRSGDFGVTTPPAHTLMANSYFEYLKSQEEAIKQLHAFLARGGFTAKPITDPDTTGIGHQMIAFINHEFSKAVRASSINAAEPTEKILMRPCIHCGIPPTLGTVTATGESQVSCESCLRVAMPSKSRIAAVENWNKDNHPHYKDAKQA